MIAVVLKILPTRKIPAVYKTHAITDHCKWILEYHDINKAGFIRTLLTV